MLFFNLQKYFGNFSFWNARFDKKAILFNINGLFD